ncbi:putative leucine-rich repeat-containing protein DDB_G0290503 [Linepithema humile]|uniref:putative leucine-rich repeat-containing protein DDB_G0290503 n=1 Tax=Linepithema humile TaxID=83485 RepID=UPI00351E5225
MKAFNVTNMNIRNNKNEICELSVKNQSEKQSYKLNESESKSNVTLKKIGQELDIAETKCFTLKSELNYMMGVCRKVQTEKKGSKEPSDVLPERITSPYKNLILKSPVEYHDYNNEITANTTPSYNMLDRIYNIEQNAEEKFDTFHLSPKSSQFSFRKSTDGDNFIEAAESAREQGLLNVKITPRTHLDKKLPPAITSMPVANEIIEANEEYDNSRISCLPEYMREHLQHLLNAEGSIEELTSKADEDYFHSMSDIVTKDIGDLELNLNILDTAKVRRTERNKHVSRMERSETNSFYKADDTISKTRKRKGKLRSSASKSTVATKETYFVRRKEIKRRKHRAQMFNADHAVIHPKPTLSKHLKKSNDVVEIFHNTTLKDSNSVVSSKHSKLSRQAKYVKKQLIEPAAQKIQEKSPSEHINHEYQTRKKENQQIENPPPQILNSQSNTEMPSENVQEKIKSEKPFTDLYSPMESKTHQYEHAALNRYDDPMFTPNYEMPTLASKLKRASRSYFSRFNFRNIPFVVGTSVTPSHNLGMNIQQVLSVMKTSQSIANDITPSLIRKVSRGMKPMSILLEQINGHCEKSVPEASSQMVEILNGRENPSVNQDKKLSPDLRHMEKDARMPNVSGNNSKMISEKDNNSFKQFYKEKGDSYDHEIKKQSFTFVNKSNKPSDAKSQQQSSKTSLQKKDNVGDQRMRIPGAHNSKETRDILINLHDQFEEMNTKYEKLQSELGKTDDKSLVRELSTLEKELNVKEEEINAVVGLYKEVMTLKQQMKILHDKNSLVCIATESAKGPHKNSLPISIIPGKSHSNPTQILGRSRVYGAMQEPSTSMQLAALLRQIQTFHKQLQLVS